MTITKSGFALDKWQENVLATKGNLCMRSGRQVGKSTIVSMKAAEYAIKNPKKLIMIIACTERQAYLLFEKTLSYLHDHYKHLIKMGKDRPTKHKITLKNGTTIYSLPAGQSGYGIRGFTVDLLIADEAAFIPEDVWTAVTPMMAVTHGDTWLLSTPHGKEGYYYDCFNDPTYTKFHISCYDCPRIPEEFLAHEKARHSRIKFAQEYLGEFIDELRQFFPTELIKKCMVIDRNKTAVSTSEAFLGVDVARMGQDETVLASLSRIKRKKLVQFGLKITRKTYLTETIKLIKEEDSKWKYKKIYIDDGGMGVGVFDPLLEDAQTKRKVVAINNASRSIDHEDGKKKLLKEDLYNNLLALMEQGKIELFTDDEIFLSLKSIQKELTDSKKLKIYGRYSHITEALIRAAWCMKDKSLNIYIY